MAKNELLVHFINDVYLKKQEAENVADVKRGQLHEQFPEISAIDAVLSKTGARILEAVRNSQDVEKEIEKLEAENNSLLKKRKSILLKNNIAADFDEPVYSCDICNDEAYIEGKLCSCIRKRYNEDRFINSGLGKSLIHQDFENFSLQYYTKKANTVQNDRDVMENNLNKCIEASELIGKKQYNLLMIGGSGLGKTHLSTAIAKAVLNNGFSVIYESAQNIFNEYEENHFNRMISDVKRYERVDLLIIDDLGAEFRTGFTVAVLYNLINMRHLNGLSTIINTNLSSKELKKAYQERILSRLLGHYEVLFFQGRDIRMLQLDQ